MLNDLCSSSLKTTATLNSFPVTSVTLVHPYRIGSGFVRRSNPSFFFMGLRKKECALSSGRERTVSSSWQPLTTLPFVSISSASQRSGMQMRLAHTIGSRQSVAEGPWPESAQHTTSPGCMLSLTVDKIWELKGQKGSSEGWRHTGQNLQKGWREGEA